MSLPLRGMFKYLEIPSATWGIAVPAKSLISPYIPLYGGVSWVM
jgi:hypothetical protein